MPKLLVVLGSTRPGRAALPIGRWFAAAAEAHGGFDVEIADLAELDLPLLDEPHHPRLRRYTQDHTRAWSAIVDGADAVVFVTPEYNYGYPAALKNAIDFLHEEWRDKPVGFVSYGGIAAGTRAVQQLKQVVTTLRMTPVFDAVNIPFHARLIGEDGAFHAEPATQDAATAMLDELARVGAALQPLREAAKTF